LAEAVPVESGVFCPNEVLQLNPHCNRKNFTNAKNTYCGLYIKFDGYKQQYLKKANTKKERLEISSLLVHFISFLLEQTCL
ncbi:hypothetical protein, partial [Aquibacillus rhizosphaerae]